ncbi:electron transfer flavoprotein subunit beta/FixA family protein [Acholeplasma sp. OttesenSCG-928-E16]|nr:electron transfer flavoprotein subunit beta/FixA family protein [Acholeplasma sp. OttesenSCG-928-E16]
MKIITCVKQVPATTEVEIDPQTGNLVRDANNVKMNPFDLYGLEMAFEIKEKIKDSSVHAISMGPLAALGVLNESLYMGADEATLISDRRMGGADVLATAYTISQLVKFLKPFDIVICGKQTTDGDTAQVGPEMAEFLGIPHVPYVTNIIKVTDKSITLRSAYDDYDEEVEVSYPCLITVEKDSNVPRLPSYKRKQEVLDYKIKVVSLGDLEDQNPAHYGLTGSPTQVDEIFPPNKSVDSKLIKGSKKEIAKELFDVLLSNKYL